MILRHELAIQRTILANERTLLAYTRTSLTLVVPGITFYYFIESPLVKIIGLLFIPIGVGMFSFGVYRFFKKKERIRKEKDLISNL